MSIFVFKSKVVFEDIFRFLGIVGFFGFKWGFGALGGEGFRLVWIF